MAFLIANKHPPSHILFIEMFIKKEKEIRDAQCYSNEHT